MRTVAADVGFILRHIARDLPWLGGIAIVIGAGFALWPLLVDGGSVGQALDTGAAFAIGFAAVLPMFWVRYRTVRDLSGRRTAIAVALGIGWAAIVFLLALPFLESLDGPP